MAVRTLTHTLTLPDGTGIEGVEVEAVIMPKPGFNASTKAELLRVTAVTNSSGVWTLSLLPNAEITPAGTYYRITENIPADLGGMKVVSVLMPNANSNLYDILLEAGEI